MMAEKLALALSGLGVIQRYQPTRMTGLELTNMLTAHNGVDKIKEKIDASSGGVLVIDEAHQLAETSLGEVAAKLLLDPMIEKRYEMSFVFCCYPEKVKAFLDLEKGLARRITERLDFEDYTAEEILQILGIKMRGEGYRAEDAVMDAALALIGDLIAADNQNGGTAEKLFRALKTALGVRVTALYGSLKELSAAAEEDPALLYTFLAGDVDQARILLAEANGKDDG